MNTRVSKGYHWEMSHRLPQHNGLCKNIHGHTYRMRLDIIGEILPESGVVIDFFDIDKIVMPILNKLDHAFLCEKSDTLILDFLKANDFKYEVIDSPSTCENIIEYFADLMQPEFKKLGNITEINVRVYETLGVFAETTRRI